MVKKIILVYILDSEISKSAHERILRNGQKRPPGGKENGQILFWPFFVKRPIKPLGKLVRTQKTDCKNLFSSRSYKSSKFGQIRPFGWIWPKLQASVAFLPTCSAYVNIFYVYFFIFCLLRFFPT